MMRWALVMAALGLFSSAAALADEQDSAGPDLSLRAAVGGGTYTTGPEWALRGDLLFTKQQDSLGVGPAFEVRTAGAATFEPSGGVRFLLGPEEHTFSAMLLAGSRTQAGSEPELLLNGMLAAGHRNRLSSGLVLGTNLYLSVRHTPGWRDQYLVGVELGLSKR